MQATNVRPGTAKPGNAMAFAGMASRASASGAERARDTSVR